MKDEAVDVSGEASESCRQQLAWIAPMETIVEIDVAKFTAAGASPGNDGAGATSAS